MMELREVLCISALIPRGARALDPQVLHYSGQSMPSLLAPQAVTLALMGRVTALYLIFAIVSKERTERNANTCCHLLGAKCIITS